MKYCCERFMEISNKKLIRQCDWTLQYYINNTDEERDCSPNITYCPFCGAELK